MKKNIAPPGLCLVLTCSSVLLMGCAVAGFSMAGIENRDRPGMPIQVFRLTSADAPTVTNPDAHKKNEQPDGKQAPRTLSSVATSIPHCQSSCREDSPELMPALSSIEIRRGMYDSLGQLHSYAEAARPSNSSGVPKAVLIQRRNDIWEARIPTSATRSHAGDDLIRMAAFIAIDATLAQFHYHGALPYPYSEGSSNIH